MASTNTQYLQKNKSEKTSRDEYYWKLNASVSGSNITYSCYIKGSDTSLYGSYYHYIDAIYLYKNGSKAATLHSEQTTIGYRSQSGGSYHSLSFTTGTKTLSFEKGDTLTLQIVSHINDGSEWFYPTWNITIDAYKPSIYTITFDANGGSGAPKAQTCAPGKSITIPTTKPTRSNRIFLGWSGLSNASFSTAAYLPGSIYTPDASKTLYAVWGYKLTINPNGGTMINSSYYDSNNQDSYTTSSDPYTVGFTKTSSYGRDLANFEAGYWHRTVNNIKYYNIPSRTGYTFKEWTVTSGNGEVVYEAPNTTHLQLFYNDNKYCYIRNVGTDYGVYYYINNATSPTNSTITAQWTPNTYTVTYDVNGGNALSTTTKSVTYGNKYGTLSTPTRTGYTFDGWFTAASGGTKITANTTVSTASNHTLYAHWTANTYTVTFDAKGGSTPNPTSKTVTYNSSYGTLPSTSKTGYTFKGWYTAASGGTKITSNSTVSIVNNQTLYAQWTANTYTVTFRANGGNTPNPTSKTVTYNESYGTLATCTQTGYTFKGWFTAASGGTEITTNTVVKITSNQTLYAQWTANTYTVNFNSVGGSTPNPTSKTVAYNGSYGTLPTVTKTGYTFDGWFTAASGGTEIISTSTVTTISNHSLYAHWTINNYKLTLNKSSGISTVTGGGNYNYDSSVNIGATVSDGYHWVNWTKGTTTTVLTTNQTYSFKMPAAATTYKANAAANTYTVKYNGNGATSGSMTSVTHTYDTAKTLSANQFKRIGYTFLGWSESSTATEPTYLDRASVSNLTTINNGQVELFAIWKPYTQMYIAVKNSNGVLEFKPALKYIYTTS